MPPPGAPEFDWRFTPLILPTSAVSIVGAGTLVVLRPPGETLRVVALRRSTVGLTGHHDVLQLEGSFSRRSPRWSAARPDSP
jgi:hypothetical protein